MRARLLLFDLDGTLLMRDRTIHPATRAALRRAMEADVLVGIATGRSPRCTAPHATALGPNAPCIHYNGAMVRRFDTGLIVAESRLPLAPARAALQVLAARGVHANVYVDDDIAIAQRSTISEASEVKDGVPHLVVGDVDAHVVARGAPTKILAITGDPSAIPALTSALAACLDGACDLVNSEPDYLEVLPRGCSKGAALTALCADVGVSPDEVIAFGDNLNDVELLQAAGLGVAMGDGHPALQAVADVVIGSHDGPAIAEFLSSFTLVDGALLQAGPRPHAMPVIRDNRE